MKPSKNAKRWPGPGKVGKESQNEEGVAKAGRDGLTRGKGKESGGQGHGNVRDPRPGHNKMQFFNRKKGKKRTCTLRA